MVRTKYGIGKIAYYFVKGHHYIETVYLHISFNPRTTGGLSHLRTAVGGGGGYLPPPRELEN